MADMYKWSRMRVASVKEKIGRYICHSDEERQAVEDQEWAEALLAAYQCGRIEAFEEIEIHIQKKRKKTV